MPLASHAGCTHRARARRRLLTALTALAGTGLVPAAALAAKLSGQPAAINGNTFRLAGETLRLRRAEVPALEQICRHDDKAEVPCGQEAKEALTKLFGTNTIDCIGRGRDWRSRLRLADCTLSGTGTDLATALIEQGWAIVNPCYRGRGKHLEAELQARYHRRGLWAYQFEAPWLYRARADPAGKPPRRCERQPIGATWSPQLPGAAASAPPAPPPTTPPTSAAAPPEPPQAAGPAGPEGGRPPAPTAERP